MKICVQFSDLNTNFTPSADQYNVAIQYLRYFINESLGSVDKFLSS